MSGVGVGFKFFKILGKGFLKLQPTPYPPSVNQPTNLFHCSGLKSNFATGLLPAISRVWASFDSALFLWNYHHNHHGQQEENTDLVYFDKIQYPILSVASAPPKTGVSFAEPRPHTLLVVATTADILLLGLNFRDGADGNFHNPSTNGVEQSGGEHVGDKRLVGRILFKAPLDGMVVSALCCSQATGRVFFAVGGELYEVEYWTRTWYGTSGCTLVNHSKGMLSYLLPMLSMFRTTGGCLG